MRLVRTCHIGGLPERGFRGLFISIGFSDSDAPSCCIKDCLDDTAADICLIQETWLFKRDLDVLSGLHENYLGSGKSAIPDNEILVGRPFGGIGILWKNTLSEYIKPICIESNRINGVEIKV